MLKPSVQIHNHANRLVAEFWDCLRLDPTPVQDLRKHYETHIRGGGLPEIVVDLSGVGFAGSSSLGNFVSLHRLARQNGGRLIFCNVEPTVGEVFRASKLESLFEFVPDRPAALLAIERGPGAAAAERAEIRAANPTLSDGLPSGGDGTGIGRFRRRNDGTDPAKS